MLKPFGSSSHTPYPAVALYHQGRRLRGAIHRLVCAAFHGPPTAERNFAAHKDGNPENNTPDNLYWASRAENMQDMVRHGRGRKGPRPADFWGERHWAATLSDEDIREILAAPRTRGSGVALARKFHMNPSNISAIRNGRRWRHITAPNAFARRQAASEAMT